MRSLHQLEEYAKEIFKERLTRSVGLIQRDIEKEEHAIRSQMLQALDRLFLTGSKKQSEKRKRAIAYVHIFYLRSAVLTNTYELQMELRDETGYMDKETCREFWVPEFIMGYFREDMEYFKKKAVKNVVGVSYVHLQRIKRKYYSVYATLIGQYFLQEIKQIETLDSFWKLEKTNELQVIYGEYMGEGVCIYPRLEVSV